MMNTDSSRSRKAERIPECRVRYRSSTRAQKMRYWVRFTAGWGL